MSEILTHLDIVIRLTMIVELGALDKDARKLCEDALEEIERLRAEVKKLKYLAKL
jgi:hypothetical protein